MNDNNENKGLVGWIIAVVLFFLTWLWGFTFGRICEKIKSIKEKKKYNKIIEKQQEQIDSINRNVEIANRKISYLAKKAKK